MRCSCYREPASVLAYSMATDRIRKPDHNAGSVAASQYALGYDGSTRNQSIAQTARSLVRSMGGRMEVQPFGTFRANNLCSN